MTRMTACFLKVTIILVCLALLIGAIAHRSDAAQASAKIPQQARTAFNLSDQTSAGDPAGVQQAYDAYIAWTGTDSKHSLNITMDNGCSSLNDSCFSSTSTFAQYSLSGQGPSLATFTPSGGFNAIYMAWVGTNNHLNVIYCANTCAQSSSWTLPNTLPETSNYRPSLAGLNNLFYIAWTGTDGRINIESSTDGLNWGSKVVSSETSQTAPSLTAYGGALWVTWVGTDANSSLNMAQFNGNGLVNKVKPGGAGVVNNPGTCHGGTSDRFYIAWTTGARPGSSLYYLGGVPSSNSWTKYYIPSATPLYGAGAFKFFTFGYVIWADVNGQKLQIAEMA